MANRRMFSLDVVDTDRYGLFTDKIETDVDMDLNITIDYGDE